MTSMEPIADARALAAVEKYAKAQAALAANYLERAKAIAPLIERDANETERLAMLTLPVHDALAANGLYWMSIPEDLGGPGLGPAGAIPVLEEVTRADASTGWSLMANAFNNAMAAGHLPDEGAFMLWGGKEKANTCGQFAAMGIGTEGPDGVRGGGQFRFGSGSGRANWIGGGVVLHKDGKPIMNENGQPEARVIHVPMADCRMHGGWDVIGLTGTSSFDYEIPEQLVPPHLVFNGDPMAAPLRGGPLLHIGWFGIGSAGHCSVALGLARRALEEVAAIVHGRPRMGYTVPVHEHPVFRHELAMHDANFWATRALVLQAFWSIEETVVSGGKPDELQMSRLRQACSQAHKMAVEVVRFCHHWGASQSFRNPTVLGRCTRDLAVATQHIIADQAAWSDCAEPIYLSWLRPDKAGNQARASA